MSPWLIAYIVSYLIVARVIAGSLAWAWSHSEKPSVEDWLFASISGGMIGLFAPVIITAYLMGKVIPAVGLERQAKQKIKNEEQKEELDRRATRIRELERELEI